MALGVVAVDAALLGAGVGLGTWLLVQQATFAAKARAVAGIDLSAESADARVAVGERTVVRLRATLADALPFAITVTLDLPPSTDRPTPPPVVSLRPGERSTETTFETASRVVGPLDLGPANVEFGDPEGLFVDTVSREASSAVDVRPSTSRRLHVGEGGRAMATLYGEHRANEVGAGLEPYEVRQYAPGDQLSRIDWKATARLNHPHIREYERTRTYQTVLVVDHRAPMSDGPGNETKLDHLREVGLSFVDAANDFGDPLGLYTVGDGGTTTAREPTAGVEQYDAITRALWTLEPTETEPADATADALSPTEARTRAARLRRDRTDFGATLRPYLESNGYARRLRDRPLFRTVKLAHTRVRGSSWAVVLTDDSNRTEVREATKLARRKEWRVLVFLAPSMLYESEEPDDIERAYERYREFEEFRRSLARLDRVSAFEVGPNDRLETVIGRHAERGRPSDSPGGASGASTARQYEERDEGTQNPLRYTRAEFARAEKREQESESESAERADE